ncbi:MAG: amidohydrolase [Firmicutes bacterium]|nr:amidohydrolase [Bacillota bacterium]
MTILERSKAYEEYVVQMRRWLHENPELSGREFGTLKKIDEELSAYGIEHVEVENGGIIGFIRGAEDGPVVLLRADMDALPVEELQNLNGSRACFSKNKGVMHACGHDGHTAMLLAAARMLSDMKGELKGTVVLAFERSEEIRTPAGARYLWKYIYDNGIRVDSCYATHVYSMIPSGTVGINDEAAMSGISRFDVTIEGKGGHGSRPDQSNNPIDCFVTIYQRIEALRMLTNDPYKPVTVSVGKLEGGKQMNVIPQELSFGGTVRFFDMAESHKFMNALKKTIDLSAEMCGCKVRYNIFEDPFYISTVNDPVMADFARRAINEDFGDGSAHPCEPWMASETYGGFLAQWPGVLCLLGVGDPEKGSGAAHHNGQFDIDESVLIKGVAAAVCYAKNFLEKGAELAESRKQYRMSLKELLIANDDKEALEEFFGE